MLLLLEIKSSEVSRLSKTGGNGFFLSLLILSGGLIAGGLVRTVLSPDVPGEFLQAELRMAEGAAEGLASNTLVQGPAGANPPAG